MAESRQIAAIADDLQRKRVNSRDLVARCFERIDDPSGQGSKAFVRLFRDSAYATATAWDGVRASGAPMPSLGGIPVSVKDLCSVAGSITLAGSVVLKNSPPAALDAPVVSRLRAAGAIIIGTTNMTEFAMGGLGINPHYGTPLNPYDRATGRIPGGSSSGAAVSVADGMVAGAIGSDTAGSIQMPAAFCGITGFKPTARRVPLEGTIPLAPSLDSIGSLANSVSCCALLDAVLAGESVGNIAPVLPDRLRLGLPKTLVLDDLEPAVANAFSRALSLLSQAGMQIVEIPFTELGELPLLNAKGGFSVVEGYAWHRQLLEEHGDLYDPIVARRFLSGASISAADYIALCRARADLIRRCAPLTRDFDAIIMPTVPLTAPALSDFDGNENLWLSTNRRMIRNPGVANFLDRCAISIPCHEPGSAPVALSFMGETMGDRRLLAIGLTVEQLLSRRNS